MSKASQRFLLPIEGGLLLLISPLLMFPTLNQTLTLVAVVLLVGWWLLELGLARIPIFPRSPFSPPLILFSLAIIIGSLITADPDLTWPKALGLLLGIAWWRYLATAIKNGRAMALALLFFLLAGLGMTAIGAISADWRDKIALLSDILALLPAQLVQLPGAADSGTHTNELGGTIVIYLPLLITMMVGWPPLRKRPLLILLCLGVAFSAVIVLLLSQSRSAWIGAAGSIGLLLLAWFYFLPSSRPKRIIQITAVVLALLLVVVASQLDWGRLIAFIEEPPRETAVGTFTTINFRTQLWESALEIIADTPFTGTGLGAFRRVVPRLYPIAASDSNDVAHAHNIFLQVAVDTGLLGLISYTTLLLLAAVTSFKVAYRQNQDKALIFGLFAGLVGLHLFGLTDALAPGAKPAILFWIALGLITALYNQNSTEQKKEE